VWLTSLFENTSKVDCKHVLIKRETELISIMPITANIVEKVTKIPTFHEVGNSTPLCAKNLTIVESTTTMSVKIKIKIREFLLLKLNEK
jgi:hypothetical protein